MRRLEWIGLPSLLNQPVVAMAFVMKRYTPEQEMLIRRAAERRHPRIDGRSVRRFEPRYFPGLSRTYEFGPDCYVLEVGDDDAAVLLGSDAARQFEDVTDGHAPARALGVPDLEIEPISEEEFRSFDQYVQSSRRFQPAR